MFPASGIKFLRVLASSVVIMVWLWGCSDLGRPIRLEPHGEVSSTRLDFGSVAVADSASRSIVVHNSGTAELPCNVSISCDGFRLVSGGGAFVIPPGGSRDLVIRFAPGLDTDYTCRLDLGPACPAVVLAGRGALQAPGAACEVVPRAIDFGALLVGQTAVHRFTIHSVGTVPLAVNVIASCSDLLPIAGGGTATIPPGDSIEVQVLIDPRVGGSFECEIATGPGCPSVRVTGVVASVSFGRDVQKVFSTYCTGCHGGSGGLYLNPGASYSNLVGVISAHYSAPRVKPGEPENSVLYDKVAGLGRYGASMRYAGPDDIEKIRVWIREGALNN
jgi:hypothetical protein